MWTIIYLHFFFFFFHKQLTTLPRWVFLFCFRFCHYVLLNSVKKSLSFFSPRSNRYIYIYIYTGKWMMTLFNSTAFFFNVIVATYYQLRTCIIIFPSFQLDGPNGTTVGELRRAARSDHLSRARMKHGRIVEVHELRIMSRSYPYNAFTDRNLFFTSSTVLIISF